MLLHIYIRRTNVIKRVSLKISVYYVTCGVPLIPFSIWLGNLLEVGYGVTLAKVSPAVVELCRVLRALNFRSLY